MKNIMQFLSIGYALLSIHPIMHAMNSEKESKKAKKIWSEEASCYDFEEVKAASDERRSRKKLAKETNTPMVYYSLNDKYPQAAVSKRGVFWQRCCVNYDHFDDYAHKHQAVYPNFVFEDSGRPWEYDLFESEDNKFNDSKAQLWTGHCRVQVNNAMRLFSHIRHGNTMNDGSPMHEEPSFKRIAKNIQRTFDICINPLHKAGVPINGIIEDAQKHGLSEQSLLAFYAKAREQKQNTSPEMPHNT